MNESNREATGNGDREGEGLIRCREAARLLGMSEWLLRKLAHEHELPYIQRSPTSPMLFDPVDLRKWIEREKIRENALVRGHLSK